MIQPLLSLKLSSSVTTPNVEGPHRFIGVAGRLGYHPLSRNTVLRLPTHQHAQEKGTFVLWLCPLETLSVSPPLQHTAAKNPLWQEYPLIYDALPGGDVSKTIFSWYWRSVWHPQMVAKYTSGAAGGAAADFLVQPYVPVEHMPLHERQWYQLVFAFDKPASRFRIYINGVLCGTTKYPFQCEAPHPELYLGNPAMVFADLGVYDQELTQEEVQALFIAGGTSEKAEIHHDLLGLFTIQPKPAVDWKADSEWKVRFDKSLTRTGDFDGWLQQGCMVDGITMKANEITSEGLLLQTPEALGIETRVYFWSPEVYEGDLAVEFEFQPEKQNGLALLVLQAAGMQGEDFWTDHAPRVTGSMNTIIGDEVKNYHWEFFRHAVDVRNDLGTNVLVKNPWCKPLAMSTTPLVELHRWHKLLFVQEGARLRCAIDGHWVLDVTDSGFSHSGPVFHSGRVGIRQMYDTKIRYKNLKIWNRSPIEV